MHRQPTASHRLGGSVDEWEADDTSRPVCDLDVTFRLIGDLDDAQRARIIEIAGKCPVEKTITGELKVRVNAG